jgi:hypothetical protein
MHANTTALMENTLRSFRVYSKYYASKVVRVRARSVDEALEAARKLHRPLATRPAVVAIPE